MIEREVEIQTPDGTADGYIYYEDDGKRRPGVIELTDIRGIRPATRDMARRLAGQGYVVLLPNVFYRTRRPPVFDFEMQWGTERTMQRFAELTQPITPDAMERDGAAYVDFLSKQPQVAAGPMGAVGYCFSGALALRTAAVRPDRVRAAASFHGGGLWSDKPTSPHLVLPRVTADLLIAHADQDRSMPAILGGRRSGCLMCRGPTPSHANRAPTIRLLFSHPSRSQRSAGRPLLMTMPSTVFSLTHRELASLHPAPIGDRCTRLNRLPPRRCSAPSQVLRMRSPLAATAWLKKASSS